MGGIVETLSDWGQKFSVWEFQRGAVGGGEFKPGEFAGGEFEGSEFKGGAAG